LNGPLRGGTGSKETPEDGVATLPSDLFGKEEEVGAEPPLGDRILQGGGGAIDFKADRVVGFKVPEGVFIGPGGPLEVPSPQKGTVVRQGSRLRKRSGGFLLL